MEKHLKEYNDNELAFNKLDARDKEYVEQIYQLKQIHLLLWMQLNQKIDTKNNNNLLYSGDGNVGLENDEPHYILEVVDNKSESEIDSSIADTKPLVDTSSSELTFEFDKPISKPKINKNAKTKHIK